MNKYITLAKPPVLEEWWETRPKDAITVICEDDTPTYTGLFDQYGTPLYRVSERLKPGFV